MPTQQEHPGMTNFNPSQVAEIKAKAQAELAKPKIVIPNAKQASELKFNGQRFKME